MAGEGRSEPGGSASLVGLIGDYRRQFEGDLRFYYQLDLRDLWKPHGGPSRMTLRLVGVLWERLPAESATVTAVRDDRADDPDVEEERDDRRPGAGPWSATNLLLADIYDSLERLNYYTLAANAKSPPAKPQPMPRPGVTGRRRLTAEQRAKLEAMRDGREAVG